MLDKFELINSLSQPCPAVSVIIPLYNAEKYIGDCLESLLNQTFQNFEVIVVDDCSVDNSAKIVESYAPKFNGRLTLTIMEKNSGSGALPRNKGLSLSCGEYIQFLDADDMLTKTALEELYGLAKDYDADVVYCERYYNVDAKGTNIRVHSYQKGILADTPTFESEDFAERVRRIVNDRYLTVPWNKLVKRKPIIKNRIFFPNVRISEDNIWNQNLLFCTKKFLRVPNIVYIYRLSENSMVRFTRSPQQKINFWLNPVLLGLKALDKILKRHKFFKENLSYRFELLKKFINARFTWTLNASKELTDDVIYSTLKEEFSKRLGKYDVLISVLCALMYEEKKARDKDAESFRQLQNILTARIDVKLIPKGEGKLQILSTSDAKAIIKKADWLPKNESGYFIQSYAGKMELIVKATVDGQIRLAIRGLDVRNPEDKSKRIPYWIDYTKLVVNGKFLFDELTPTWHDKPFIRMLDAKADEEIKIQVEWQPHRSDT